MNIPFKVKLLTETAKAPERANDGDLWDLFADDFCYMNINENEKYKHDFGNLKYKNDCPELTLNPQGRILVKTGIAIELPKMLNDYWHFEKEFNYIQKTLTEQHYYPLVRAYAVADIRPRSGLALKHGITVLNAPGTIDNSYRKEIGVILINHGHEPYKIKKGDKIAQMLIRPLYPSSFEIVKDFEDTGRGGYNSTGY